MDKYYLRRVFPYILYTALLIVLSVGQTFAQNSNNYGRVVSWGDRVVPNGYNSNFIDVSAGRYHNLALRSDGTIAAWGSDSYQRSTVPEGLNDIEEIATGWDHSLALRSDGTVSAWGRDSYNKSTVPVNLYDVTDIAAGGDHSLALRVDGTVVAWGRGQSTIPGELDDAVEIAAGENHSLALLENGTVAAWGYDYYNAATVPEGLDDVTKIAAGVDHSLALREDGTVVAWGRDNYDQITVPPGLDGVVDIAAGGWHNLALLENGTVVAWGADGYSQSSVPQGLNDVVAISAGLSHNLALKDDGTTVAWGRDTEGQGNIQLGLTNVVGVASGWEHSLALRSDGTVAAWGEDDHGQSTVPEELDDVIDIAIGEHHSLALRADGTVVTWGTDFFDLDSVPEGLDDVVAVDAGVRHNIALHEDGRVTAWGGQNRYGEISVPDDLKGVAAIAAGSYHNLALKTDGSVVSWGIDRYGLGTVPEELYDVVAIAAGGHHSVVLLEDGRVLAWGRDNYGQSTVPPWLDDFGSVIAIAAGQNHSLALREDGTVIAWGETDYGKINTPPGLQNVVAISAGMDHNLAIVDVDFDDSGEALLAELENYVYSQSYNQLTVPVNGSGYFYAGISSESELNFESTGSIPLMNRSDGSESSASARLMNGELLQIEVPFEVLNGDDDLSFETGDELMFGNQRILLSNEPLKFTASSTPLIYNRTWSIFAGGSAGVSGTIGSVGVGASVAAAKASIKGSAGLGLNIRTNEQQDLFLTRRSNIGISGELETPSINTVIESEDINVEAGVSTELTTTASAGQTVSFSHLQYSEDQKRMAEAGFLLETLSISGAAISPAVGVLIPAIVNTINGLSGVDVMLENAVLTNYGGLGLEGSISSGIGADFGPFNIQAMDATSGFVLNSNYYSYPISNSVTKESEKFHRLYRSIPPNDLIRTAVEVKTAVEYELSTLEWGLLYGNSTFKSGSLFSKGAGSEMGMRANFDESENLHSLELSLSDGNEHDIFTENRSVIQTTEVRIPGVYSSLISNNDLGVSSLFTPGSTIPFGILMAKDFQNTFNLVSENIDNDYPVEVTAYESHGRGVEYDYSFSPDAALGVGLGFSIGFEYSMYDEVSFPKNHVEVYDGAQSYTLYSSEYHPEMMEDDLSDVFNGMMYGAFLLADNAIDALLSRFSDVVEAGEEYFSELSNRFGDAVSSIRGTFESGGEFIVNIFSPRSNRVNQKAFKTPEIRHMYSNPNVFQEIPKKTVDGEAAIAEVGSELIIISDVTDLSFIPQGEENPVNELNNPVEIEMIIYESDLTDNDFSESDKESVKLYRYLSEEIGWVRIESELDEDTVSAEVTTLGSYALGIEINRSDDSVAPEIYKSGYLEAADNEGVDEIFALVRDNRYGIGVDFGNTFVIVNDDTVSYSYQPANERIFFDLTDYSNLTGEIEEVKIVATDFAGNQTTDNFSFERVITSTEDETTMPDRFVLHDNYPNPFNPQTVIPFELAEAAHVEINIYDVAGRFVARIADEQFSAGSHQVAWDTSVGQGRELSSGVYFYQVKSEGFNQVKKMMLIK